MCLISEAGGWHSPFLTSADSLVAGGPVLAGGPGAKDDLLRIAQA
jgi:myo-inositol-1(or 4)-monophosphatase